MRKILYLIICMPLWFLSACNVHEWPESPELVKMHLRLNYETEMTEWEHLYDGTKIKELGLGETYDNRCDYGKIRYIVRTYPILNKQRSSQSFTQEFVFVKDIVDGYDHEVTLDLLPGDYNVMVWSDLVQSSLDSYFYDATDFAEIKLQGEHKGNTDYRDAFRGANNISLVADVVEHAPKVLDVIMQRPLAKFEFITTDLQEFLNKELTRIALKDNANRSDSSNDDSSTRAINIEDYKVVLYYTGYMPYVYNMSIDKPIDAKLGVSFMSKLNIINDKEAVLGSDYLFVNGSTSVVTVQIGLYDQEDQQLALSDPINLPLKRNLHTILRGSFLIQQASGGITINPDFDGNHNIVIE